MRSVADIVCRQKPAILPPTATVLDACRLMRERRIGAVLVADTDGQLVGLFTGRDAVGRVLAERRDPGETLLATVMTEKPDTLGPKALAIEALRLMQDGGYRHVPVVDGKEIVGILSFADFEGLERHDWMWRPDSGQSCDPVMSGHLQRPNTNVTVWW
jgi:CBS domain-containing protein